MLPRKLARVFCGWCDDKIMCFFNQVRARRDEPVANLRACIRHSLRIVGALLVLSSKPMAHLFVHDMF